ncbi:MAG: lipoprotein [Aeromicrobium sp.]|nr:lipoprotein [Aeromicrobium sp.]
MVLHPVRLVPTAGLALLLLATAACGGSGSDSSAPAPSRSARSSSTPSAGDTAPVPVESNPPGDIPDNLAFVPYVSTTGHYSFTHPEGWARTATGQTVTFTDKLNGVIVTSRPGTTAPTVASAKRDDLARLKAAVPAFQLKSIGVVKLPAGAGVHIVFRRNSDADPVTGKIYRDEVEEYVVLAGRRVLQMDLFGPVGADNVDAYRTMSQSLRSR